ncbi:MAG TPA: hypothetical protein VJN93_10410 [Candidatus Acidoferrum sp.]|nr:hypothetical protein [Candidatus Acidoferrum sp.]
MPKNGSTGSGLFRIRCESADSEPITVSCTSLKLGIGQLIHENAGDAIWDSVVIECEQSEDHMLTVSVVIRHPAWDAPIRVVQAVSVPADRLSEEPALGFDLEHMRL